MTPLLEEVLVMATEKTHLFPQPTPVGELLHRCLANPTREQPHQEGSLKPTT